MKELTKPLYSFPKGQIYFQAGCFLLNTTALLSVHVVISVLLGLHLTEEITISMNNETDSFVVVPAKADEGTVCKRRLKLLFM